MTTCIMTWRALGVMQLYCHYWSWSLIIVPLLQLTVMTKIITIHSYNRTCIIIPVTSWFLTDSQSPSLPHHHLICAIVNRHSPPSEHAPSLHHHHHLTLRQRLTSLLCCTPKYIYWRLTTCFIKYMYFILLEKSIGLEKKFETIFLVIILFSSTACLIWSFSFLYYNLVLTLCFNKGFEYISPIKSVHKQSHTMRKTCLFQRQIQTLEQLH